MAMHRSAGAGLRRACVAMVLVLLASCAGNLRLSHQRLGPGDYRVRADRCAVIDRRELHDDLERKAVALCPGGHASLTDLREIPSRQGSLLGECLHSGAMQARVACRPAAGAR